MIKIFTDRGVEEEEEFTINYLLIMLVHYLQKY